jgi:hypothetical protein
LIEAAEKSSSLVARLLAAGADSERRAVPLESPTAAEQAVIQALVREGSLRVTADGSRYWLDHERRAELRGLRIRVLVLGLGLLIGFVVVLALYAR